MSTVTPPPASTHPLPVTISVPHVLTAPPGTSRTAPDGEAVVLPLLLTAALLLLLALRLLRRAYAPVAAVLRGFVMAGTAVLLVLVAFGLVVTSLILRS